MAITFDWNTEQGVYKKLTAHTGTGVTTMLDDQQTKGMQRGCVMYVNSTIDAGTITVYFIDRDNNALELQTTPIAADSCTAIDFDFHLPRWKIAWTSSTGAATDVFVEVFPYGARR
jgi:hypothetical protein